MCMFPFYSILTPSYKIKVKNGIRIRIKMNVGSEFKYKGKQNGRSEWIGFKVKVGFGLEPK